jgi:hypothetical protein
LQREPSIGQLPAEAVAGHMLKEQSVDGSQASCWRRAEVVLAFVRETMAHIAAAAREVSLAAPVAATVPPELAGPHSTEALLQWPDGGDGPAGS